MVTPLQANPAPARIKSFKQNFAQLEFLTFLSNILKSSPYSGESCLFPQMPLPPNTSLGRYEIRSLLGTGGMGEVYLAYDTSLRRQVAIKLLPAEFTQNKVRL